MGLRCEGRDLNSAAERSQKPAENARSPGKTEVACKGAGPMPSTVSDASGRPETERDDAEAWGKAHALATALGALLRAGVVAPTLALVAELERLTAERRGPVADVLPMRRPAETVKKGPTR